MPADGPSADEDAVYIMPVGQRRDGLLHCAGVACACVCCFGQISRRKQPVYWSRAFLPPNLYMSAIRHQRGRWLVLVTVALYLCLRLLRANGKVSGYRSASGWRWGRPCGQVFGVAGAASFRGAEPAIGCAKKQLAAPRLAPPRGPPSSSAA